MAQPHPSLPDRGTGARARVIALRPELSRGAAPPDETVRPGGSGDHGPARRAEPRTDAVTGGWVPDVRRHRRGGRPTRARPRDRRAETEPGDAPPGEPEPPVPFPDEEVGEHSTGAGSDDLDDPAPSSRPAWAAQLVRRGPWGQLAERWVPESVRGARVSPGRRGAVVLSVIAALAAVVAAVGVWWGRPSPTPVTPVALPPAASAQAGAAGSASGSARPPAAGTLGATNLAMNEPVKPTAAAKGTAAPAIAATSGPTAASTVRSGPILVSVTGQVRHPGVVTVPADARVADAIAAAGGVLDPDDLTGLNLAAHLSDGDSVVVAGPGGSTVDAESSPAGRATPAVPGVQGSAASSPIDLNTADEAALEALPGVGPVTAAAIVSWRTDHGPFTSVDQLQAIPGIGPAKFAQISPHVTV